MARFCAFTQIVFVVWPSLLQYSKISFPAQATPFRITFVSDANELTTGMANTNYNTNEQIVHPGGIIGFSLNYVQQSC